MPVDDQYTKLLLHGEGKEGWNVFYDESGKVPTVYGNITTKAVNKKFGNTAINFVNTSNTDCLSFPAHTDFNLGSGDFTIDFWMAMPRLFTNNSFTGDGYKVVFSQRSGHQSNESYNLALIKRSTGYRLYFWYTTNGGTQIPVETSDYAFQINTLYHVAIVRASTTIKIYINGVCVATHTIGTNAIYSSTANMIIGGGEGMDSRVFWEGSIDEFRLSRGIARWTADFTPPTEPYGVPAEFNWFKYDEYTTFLMHLNDSITVEELYATITAFGNAALSSSQKKFGAGALSLDGNGDYLRTPYSAARFGFGTGDFTMEAWIYPTAMPTADSWPASWSSHKVIIELGTPGAGDGCSLVLGQTKLILASNDSQIISGTHNISINGWYHVAVTRSGNTFRLFVNGICVATTTNSASMGTGAYFYVGCETGEGAWFAGYIDEPRVSKGIARWTADFTPPAAEYGIAKILIPRRLVQFI